MLTVLASDTLSMSCRTQMRSGASRVLYCQTWNYRLLANPSIPVARHSDRRRYKKIFSSRVHYAHMAKAKNGDSYSLYNM